MGGVYKHLWRCAKMKKHKKKLFFFSKKPIPSAMTKTTLSLPKEKTFLCVFSMA